MSGTIALHGGGEFLPGDEAFLAAWLRSARREHDQPPASLPLRVVVVPTAAARGRPDLAAAYGVAAIDRVAAAIGLESTVSDVPVLDRASAEDPELAERIASADAIHLPGGDPDLIPSVLAGSAAWSAMRAALDDGAALAGASAGAMGLAAWTWTSSGVVRGLGLLPDPPLIVMPHADVASWASNVERFGPAVPVGVGALGIGERTAVVIGPDPGEPWRVVGQDEVRWSPADGDPARPRVFRDGEAFWPEQD